MCQPFTYLETEAIGRTHLSLAQKISEELNRSLKEFREQQRDIRKKVSIPSLLPSPAITGVCCCQSEDTVKRSATHKKSCYERSNRVWLGCVVCVVQH